jgi:hypothetical protein
LRARIVYVSSLNRRGPGAPALRPGRLRALQNADQPQVFKDLWNSSAGETIAGCFSFDCKK